jgi:hypothetical protein
MAEVTNWVKVMNSLPAHPKILRAGERAAWLYVCGLCYANEHLTDGFIDSAVLIVAAPGVKAPERLASALVQAGLWDAVDGGWQVHDYGDVQRTSEQVKDVRRKDRERKMTSDSSTTPNTDSARKPRGFRSASNGVPRDASRASRANPAQEEKRERNTPPTPSSEVEDWLAHYERTTGHSLPARTTKGFANIVASAQARLDEGHPLDDLKFATLGAHGDAYRRERGYDTADSILRPTKVAALVAQGKLRSGPRAASVSSVDLAERFRGGAA